MYVTSSYVCVYVCVYIYIYIYIYMNFFLTQQHSKQIGLYILK
jgi:hypothetical protein